MEFRQLKSTFTACIEPKSLPENYGAPNHSIFAIDQESAKAFWLIREGVAYADLDELEMAKGVVKGKLLSIKGVLNVLAHKGWLVVTTGEEILVFDITKLNSSEAIRLSAPENKSVTMAGEYICWLNASKYLHFCKLGEDNLTSYEQETFSLLAGWERSDSNVLFALVDNAKFILKFTIPDIDSSLQAKVQVPSGLREFDELMSMSALGEDHIAMGVDENMYVLSVDTGKCTLIEDAARGMLENHFLRFACIANWSSDLAALVIVADSASSDVVCGGVDVTGEYHPFFIVSEEGLLQLPLHKGEETYPVAMALDFTNGKRLEPRDPEGKILPPQPVIWVLNNNGTFCPFQIAKIDQEEMYHLMRPRFEESTESEVSEEEASEREAERERKGKIEKDEEEENENEEMIKERFNDEVIVTPQIKVPPVEDEPMLLPSLSKLTEDLGLLQNAIADEFLKLYGSFNDDLDQLRSQARQTETIIHAKRPLIEELGGASVSMAKLCAQLDGELAKVETREKKLMRLVTNVTLLNGGFDGAEYDLTERLKVAVERIERLVVVASSLPVREQREFIKKIVLPELESTLDLLSVKAVPTPKLSLRKSNRWGKLLGKLRDRDPASVVSTDRVRQSVKVEAVRQNFDVLSICRPVPSPLVMPQVTLENIRDPQRIQPARVVKSGASQTTITAAGQTERSAEKNPAEIQSRLALPPKERSVNPKTPSGEVDKKPEAKPFAFNILAAASGGSSFEGQLVENPTSELKVKAKDVVEQKPFSFNVPAVTGGFRFGTPETAKVETEKVEQKKETVVEQEKEGFTFQPVGLFKPGQTTVTTSDSPSKESSWEDVSAIDIKSPTPKGPKNPIERIETPKSPTSGFGFGFGIGEMSLDAGYKAQKEGSTVEMKGSLPFGIPTSVASIALPTKLEESKSEGSFGFRPSVLQNVAPPSATLFGESENATPVSTPSKPGFGSMQSLGVATLEPAFGAPTGFGALAKPTFGQTSSLKPTSGAGFSAFASGATGFSTIAQTGGGFGATPQGTSSNVFGDSNTQQAGNVFGSASTQLSGNVFGSSTMQPTGNIFGSSTTQATGTTHGNSSNQSGEKKNLPPSFTQFR